VCGAWTRECAACDAAAAEVLVERLGLGVRDAGELLGLSYQRVQQLVSREAR
jgi:predicted transcriptional regulator